MFEEGTASRDFVFIDDVVEATVAAIENGDADNKVFNVGTGIAISVKEAVELLMAQYERRVGYKITGIFPV